MIFGYKQKGKQAEKALNVFLGTAYEESLQIAASRTKTELHSLYEGIYHFGQIPVQLFLKPHPKKLEKEKPASIFDKFTSQSLDSKSNKRTEIIGHVYALFMTNKYLICVKSNENSKRLYLVKKKWKQEQFEFKIDGNSAKEFELRDCSLLDIDTWGERSQ